MTHVLCWDIDLTLLSTARAGVFALEDAIREVCEAEPAIANMRTAGLTDAQIAAVAIEESGQDATPERVDVFLRCYERHLPARLHTRRGSVLPGVREILDDLVARDDVLLLLLTGNTRAGAQAKLAHYGLESYFAGGGFCEGPGSRSEIALRARALAEARLDGRFDARRFFVIGDTPHDVACGKAAGARTIAVASGVHPRGELEASGPWLVLDQLPPPDEFRAIVGLPGPRLRA